MKYFTLICCLLLVSLVPRAQSWEQLKTEFLRLYNSNAYAQSVPVAQKAIEAAKKEFGELSHNYANSVNNLAIVYTVMNRYAEAAPLFIKALDTWKKLPGDNRSYTATCMNNLAVLYKDQSQYRKAEPYFAEALSIQEQVYGKKDINYINTLNNSGSLYANLGNYRLAEQYDLEAIALWKSAHEEKHPGYAASINNLGQVYQETGLYEKAERMFLQALSIVKGIHGTQHPDYASGLNNLAFLYDAMGQYKKSEELFIQSITITRQIFGAEHASYATSLSNLGILYDHLGQYEKAINANAEAARIRKKTLGEQHILYGSSLNIMGGMFARIKQYDKAEDLQTAAVRIYKAAVGENHPDYITVLSDLATLYVSMKQFEKAEPLLVKVKELREKLPGKNHPDYAASLANLASLYFESGKYSLSEKYLLESSAIQLRLLGKDHPAYVNSLYNLALLNSVMGRNSASVQFALANNKIVSSNMIRNFSFLSEKEKRNLLMTNVNRFDFSNSLLFRTGNKDFPQLASHNFRQLLVLKSLVLSDSRNILESLRNNKDSLVRKLFTGWLSARNILAKQYSLPKAERLKDLKNMEAESERLEKELNTRSSAFQSHQNLQFSLKEMQNKMDENEVALEFVRFRVYSKGWTDSTMYAAYLLNKKDTVPVFIPLFEEKQLLSLINRAGKTPTEQAERFYREDILHLSDDPPAGDSLYQLIWKPIAPYLKGVQKISYALAGKLYGLAIHALPSGQGKLLMDMYQLRQYTNTREIISRNKGLPYTTPEGIAAFGNARFTMDSSELVKNRHPGVISSVNFLRGGNAAWADLPATMEEVSDIRDLFISNKKKTVFYTGETCSEENFKLLDGKSSPVIHIATHGFFLPEPGKNTKAENDFSGEVYAFADDPLLRNGLVLAGGNYSWSGKKLPAGVEDGICTAYEISQLNLSSTALAVLSACETALGDVQGSEGVFGLQRAFKMAGVDKLIVSLWQVPDRETAELMTAFYTYWLAGKSISAAFALAQAGMRKKYKPASWAAFVLVE